MGRRGTTTGGGPRERGHCAQPAAGIIVERDGLSIGAGDRGELAVGVVGVGRGDIPDPEVGWGVGVLREKIASLSGSSVQYQSKST
jgi:hypothetical protein